MRLSILTILATLTAALALPAAEPQPISAKRDPDVAGLDSRQNYCPGFGTICSTNEECRDRRCRGCISAPDVEPNHKICY